MTASAAVWWAGGAYALLLTGVLVAARRREQGLGTLFVFGVTAFVYYLCIPLEAVAAGHHMLLLAGAGTVLRDDVLVAAAWGGVLALAGFAAGWAASGMPPLNPAPTHSEFLKPVAATEARLAQIGCWIASAILASIVLLAFGDLVGRLSSYEGNFTTLYENALMAYLLEASTLTLAVGAAYAFHRRSRQAVAAVAVGVLFAFGIYTSNKDPLLVGLLALAPLGYRLQVVQKVWFAPVAVVGALLVAAIVPYTFGIHRAGVEVTWDRMAESGIFLRSDPAGPFYSVAMVLARDADPMYGQTYVRSVVSWVPGFLWPSKPLSPSEAFARTEISNWAPGRGLGFSPLAESFQNFGLLGPLLQFALVGWGWGWFWRGLLASKVVPSALMPSLYAVVGFYLLVISHRGDTSMLVTQTVQSVAPFVGVGLVVRLALPLLRRR